MKRFHLLASVFVLGMSASAVEAQLMDPTASYFEAAMVGRPTPAPKDADALKKEDVAAVRQQLWKTYKRMGVRLGWDHHLLPVPPSPEEAAAKGEKFQLKASSLKSGGFNMPYLFMTKGKKPAAGWPMFICLHGGGAHPSPDLSGPHGWSVNTREWQAQMKLTARVYKPAGLYFIPRMAHDRWGRWWHKHNIDIFTRVIRDAILFNDVDPNRIYIMGISQGGYGSCHLAPLLADKLAAAGPMAGGMMTVTENLRNLPFRSDIGEKDTAFGRITLAKKLHASLDALKAKDPKGYENVLAIQKGRGHGIDYSLSPSWLAPHTRNPIPDRVVWRCFQKDGIYRKHFYWLSLTNTPKSGEFYIVASYDKKTNSVQVKAEEVDMKKDVSFADASRKPLTAAQVIVHLNDDMLDLDKEVTITLNGKVAFKGMVKRSKAAMMENIAQRGDVNYAFPVNITLK